MQKRGLLLVLALALAGAHPVFAQKKTLTIDDIYDPVKKVAFDGKRPRITWMGDGRAYLVASDETAKPGLLRVDVETGKAEPFVDPARLAKALEGAGGIDATAATKLAARPGGVYDPAWKRLVVESGDDLYLYDVAASQATRLTSAAGEEQNPTFSPDGKSIAFTRDDDLYVVDVATKAERRLTSGANANRYNGRLDWVYEEELYGRGETRGYWWSPDSASIAYLSFDESKVPVYVLTDNVPLEQKVENTRYPKAGDPNPIVTLGVVPAAGGETTWVDLSAYKPEDSLVVRVDWAPDSRRVVYQVQDRIQNWLELLAADARTGKPSRVLREESQAWVEVIGNPVWLADGSFVWPSDRSGYRHLYHYAADGQLLGQLTKGDWDVRELYGASRDGWVYFSAAERSPIANAVYRVKLDGSGFKRLVESDGSITASFDPTFSAFVGMKSRVSVPVSTALYRADGSIVRVVEANEVKALADYALGTPEFLKVKARDGFEMEAVMIKPPDFDPSKKYPVMSYTYAGPGAQSVRDSWGGATYLFHQALAERGYIVWILDNRSASAKGVKTAWPSYRNFGELELRDLEDGVAWLKSQPYVDGSRIGIWGWSFGGYMTSYALTHSDLFKIGIAGAPVTDWRLYDSIYTERYMGLPSDNKAGYDKSSVTLAAANLKGKLLLIHGAIDNNVHPQNSIQLIDALMKAGKQFDFMIYPQSRHGVTDPLRVKHLRQMMLDFIVENL